MKLKDELQIGILFAAVFVPALLIAISFDMDLSLGNLAGMTSFIAGLLGLTAYSIKYLEL